MTDDRLKIPVEGWLTAADEDDREKPLRPQGVNRVADGFKVQMLAVLMIPESTQCGQAKLQAEVRSSLPIPVHTGESVFGAPLPSNVWLSRSMTPLGELGAEIIFLVFELVHIRMLAWVSQHRYICRSNSVVR